MDLLLVFASYIVKYLISNMINILCIIIAQEMCRNNDLTESEDFTIVNKAEL